ncbi:ABC transporter ATP-binding protein [Virgibacillus proomii]|uniref:ABC transporter ATP-binding protein n=1 Tax=Virgibacillus proomii TaxID=84407 RepID=UPI001C0FFA42|nr:ABC transporter ATP-binding protein [Virgibacillus proomii]MBU5268066.1 ABC transporter ATP-binding protein [Virgibacillus proomii]
MESDIAVSVYNVTKKYKLYEDKWGPLKEVFFKKKLHNDFFALKNISLKFPAGESIGILGKNGSGKSTLLKIITGITEPTEGKIEVNGSLVFLDVSSGIDPELSGYENIFTKGILLGYSKHEMMKKVKDIIDFSELDDFIYQPVKNYSSGMRSKLGFAISVNVDPDILIVDEALAVGDEQFRKKCMKKMNQFKDEGKTIIFVSHDKNAIASFCSKAAWIEKGELIMYGDSKYVSDKYNEFMSGTKTIEEIKLENKYMHTIDNLVLGVVDNKLSIAFKGHIYNVERSNLNKFEFVIRNIRTRESISNLIETDTFDKENIDFTMYFNEHRYPNFFFPGRFLVNLRIKDNQNNIVEAPFWAGNLNVKNKNEKKGRFIYKTEIKKNNLELVINNHSKVEQQVDNIWFDKNIINIEGVAFVKGYETKVKDDVTLQGYLFEMKTFDISRFDIDLIESNEISKNPNFSSSDKDYRFSKFKAAIDIEKLEVGEYELNFIYKMHKEPYYELYNRVWASKRNSYPNYPYLYNNYKIILNYDNKYLQFKKETLHEEN